MDNALVRLTQVGVSFNGQAVLSDVDHSYRDGRAVYGEVQNVSGIINVVLN